MSTILPGEAPEPTDAGLRLVVPGRHRPASAGWDWVARGWKLFRLAPVMWIVAIVALIVIAIASNLLPLVGGLIFNILAPVFSAGFVAACRALEREGEFDIEHLFAGFTRRFGKLVVLGVMFVLALVVLGLLFAVVAGFSVLGAMMTGDPTAVTAAVASSIVVILLGALVVLALMIPVVAGYWFAPALVYMHDMSPWAAVKASFGACFRNLGSFLVYGIALLALLFLAMIPFGLGIVVWWPLAITSSYVAYREIFTDGVAAAPAAPLVVPEPPAPEQPPPIPAATPGGPAV